jgi:hypothetical protein
MATIKCQVDICKSNRAGMCTRDEIYIDSVWHPYGITTRCIFLDYDIKEWEKKEEKEVVR